MEGPPGPGGPVADGLTLSSGRQPGVLYVDPGGYFQLQFIKIDASSGSINYIMTAANFWGATAVMTSVLTQVAGSSSPTSTYHYKDVKQGVSELLHTISDLNTSRIRGQRYNKPRLEFLIVRTQTHIVWSARKYT